MPAFLRLKAGPVVWMSRLGGGPRSGFWFVLWMLLLAVAYVVYLLAVQIGRAARFVWRWWIDLRRRNAAGRMLTTAMLVLAGLDLFWWLMPIYENFG